VELGLGELVELPSDDGRHVYHLFVVRTPERDRVRAALDEAAIGCASYYVTPLHLQPGLRYLGHAAGDFPETERAARENLALPLWPGIEPAAQERVVDVVRSAVRERVAS
jgi:dTDP-4-amino-4,6-dideoxygalactose transaminase